MNSTISDDPSREHLASETAQCLKNIHGNTKNITTLHKELLEINLSITAYIEESKSRLKELRFQLAHNATSSQRVLEILSHKYIYSIFQKTMSNLPKTPQKRKSKFRNTGIPIREDNNNTEQKLTKQQSAKKFIVWYKSMIDSDRQHLSAYLSDDIILEWFGRTIKTRKKVSSFVKNDIQSSKHDFTTIESIDKIELRNEEVRRIDDFTSPLQSPKEESFKRLKLGKRKLQSTCLSPQWAEGCGPEEESEPTEKKKKLQYNDTDNITNDNNISMEIDNKGDGIDILKNTNETPPNIDCGQGDCHPSTSGTNSGNSYETLSTELPKLAVQCNCYIKFTRTRNSHISSADCMKWDRKCKMQISYSEDPLNVGEYIIWALRYGDESKCRRNLLSAFEEVSD